MSDVGHGKLGLRSGLQDFEDLIDESASRKDITVELRPVKEITDWTLDQSNTYVAPIELIYNGVRRDIVAIKSLLDLGPLTRVETVALCRSTSGSYYYDVDEDFGQTAMWDDGVSIWQVNGVDYDGSADYLSKAADLTGNANSKTGIISAWIRIDGGDSTARYMIASANIFFAFQVTAGNKIGVYAENGAGAKILDVATSASHVADAGWVHVLLSYDLATTTAHLYIDDVSDKSENTVTDDTIDYTRTSWGVGAAPAGGTYFNGALSELYFAPGQYLDFSVEANRRLFISADGDPVDLGGTGATPTGTAPLLYLPGPAAAVNVNEGSGGDFTINGAPAETGTSPPDDDAHLLWDQFPQLYVHLGDDSDPADTTVVAALSFHYASRTMTHPDLGPDKFTNGSLDDWTSGDLDTWVGTGAGSEAEETTEIKSGSAAKLTVTGVQDRTESQSLTTFVAARLYRYSGYYYTDGDVDAQIVVADGVVGRQWVVPGHGFINAASARQWVVPGHGMINEVGAVGLQSDGRTEEAAGLAYLTLDRTGGEWRRFCFDFRAFNATQRLIFRALGDGGTSGTVYFDEIEVRRIWRYHQHEPRLSQRSIPAISSGSNDIFFGGKRITSGAIKLDNTDGNIEELIPQLEWINQDVYVRYGGEFQDGQEILIDDYRKALTGLIQRLETTDADATFQLLDVRTFFHIILPTRVYDDLTFSNLDTAGFLGKPRPILFGVKENITPARIDLPANNYGKYEICDCTDATNGIKAIDAVYAYVDKDAADARDSTRCKTLVEGTDYTEDLTNGQFTIDKDCGPYEVTELNDWMTFHDDAPPGGDHHIHLTAGLYTAAGLATHIGTLMDAEGDDDFTVTYSDSTHKFTIASDGGTFELHPIDANFPGPGIYPVIGFDISDMKTGATSYTGDHVTFTDADKDHILRADAQGYKDDAGGTYTGTGSAIVEVGSDICYYIMNRFMRKAASIRDITSFEAARSRAAEALCIYLDESTSTKKVFDSLEYSNVANISVDGNGTVFYEIYIGEIPADIITLEDRDILQFSSSKSGQDVYSTIRVLYDEDPSLGTFEARESSDAGVGVRLGRPDAREFETYLKLADNAISVSGRMLELARTTARKIKITVRGGRMMRLRVGNKFKLTRRRAMDISGRLREEVFRIISLSKNILTGECVIEATDDRITVASNACILACQSFCESTCQELCQQACQETCELECQTACEGACQEACQLGCQTDCQLGCETTCEQICQTACEQSCQGACEGGGCQTVCQGSCQTSCETACQTACESSCQTSCQTGCETGCEIACKTGCEVSCQTACEASCQSGCQLNCQTNCELWCQTSCESTCQTASERVV